MSSRKYDIIVGIIFDSVKNKIKFVGVKYFCSSMFRYLDAEYGSGSKHTITSIF